MPASDQLFDVYQLPAQRDMFLNDWDVVVMPEETKDLLVSYAQTLRRLARVNSSGLALRRAVLLYGPPGCGKTSLARGLPARWSLVSGTPKVGFVHVNTHALSSGIRGEGQKNVLAIFREIAELATSQLPIFVLVDEVETLGSDRSSISLETNPLDALYQVTAFLESLDRCARDLPNVTFLFTTNIPKAIDRAVRERVDFVLEIPLPSAEYRSLILADAIRSMAGAYDIRELAALATMRPQPQAWTELIAKSRGLSGRALRHVLVMAATFAGDSPRLQPEHLRMALAQSAAAEEGLERSGGMYLETYQKAPPGPAGPRVVSAGPPAAPAAGAAPDAAVLTEVRRASADVREIRELLGGWCREQQPTALAEARPKRGWHRG
jgi:pachytene checkpoint protein 2